MEERLSLHLLEARKGEKSYASLKWMASVNFDVVIEEIESVVAGDRDLLYARERHWISHYRSLQGSLSDRISDDYLLNITDGGGGAVGFKHTPEECDRRKMQTGYWNGVHGKDHPAFGRVNSDDHRKAVSDSYKSNPRKGKDSHRYGAVASSETREKQAAAKRGTKASEATKLKMSFSRHRNAHSAKIKETCKWCCGANLQIELQKRELEAHGTKLETDP
jgi:hypothetical protein